MPLTVSVSLSTRAPPTREGRKPAKAARTSYSLFFRLEFSSLVRLRMDFDSWAYVEPSLIYFS